MEYHLERIKDNDSQRAIRQINQITLGQLVTVGRDGYPQASNLVFEGRENNGDPELLFHIPRRFPQYDDLESNEEALVLFTGPHGYISPSWYDKPSAPTWDFVTIQARGTPEAIDESALLEHLKRVTSYQEADSGREFSLDQLGKDYIEKYIGEIAGFQITLDSLDARYKLSQGKDAATRKNIRERLLARGLPLDAPLAMAMAIHDPDRKR